LKIKDGLTESEALSLESQIIERIEFHYEDKLTNIDQSDNMYARDGTSISFFENNEGETISLLLLREWEIGRNKSRGSSSRCNYSKQINHPQTLFNNQRRTLN